MNATQKKRILVVDDDQQIVDAVRAALETHGYDVLVARDGSEGLIRAERDAPDLIVLDVMMPKRSGFVVLERLGYRGPKGPRIIIITANDDHRHETFAHSKGADGFLRKPFDMRALVTLTETLLGG